MNHLIFLTKMDYLYILRVFLCFYNVTLNFLLYFETINWVFMEDSVILSQILDGCL